MCECDSFQDFQTTFKTTKLYSRINYIIPLIKDKIAHLVKT